MSNPIITNIYKKCKLYIKEEENDCILDEIYTQIEFLFGTCDFTIEKDFVETFDFALYNEVRKDFSKEDQDKLDFVFSNTYCDFRIEGVK